MTSTSNPIDPLPGERVTVPRHLLSAGGGEHYVLRIVGESMRAEGFFDGDFVICLRRDVAEPGEAAVVLVGGEATIKRVYPEGETIRLQPINPDLSPIRVPAADVRVQAVVVGLMRKF